MTQLTRTFTITLTSGYPSDFTEFESALARVVSRTNANKLGVAAMSQVSSETKLATLSPREHELISILDQGKSNKEIAIALDCTEATVKSHLKNIGKKLGVRKRIQIITTYRALQLGASINA